MTIDTLNCKPANQNAHPFAGGWITDLQLAAHFCVCRETIWRWAREGDFPKPVKLRGNTSRWRRNEIVEWDDEQVA